MLSEIERFVNKAHGNVTARRTSLAPPARAGMPKQSPFEREISESEEVASSHSCLTRKGREIAHRNGIWLLCESPE